MEQRLLRERELLRRLPPLLALALLACAPPDEGTDPGPYAGGKADGVADLHARVGGVFQMEHFGVQALGSIERTIEKTPPGSIVFWNPDDVHARELRRVIASYSRAAREAAAPPILFSADYEGGALSRSHTWRRIPGVQRFTDGVTALAHPRWLGVAYDRDPELARELARLHGRILAHELRSVGISFPLSVVSDLAYRLFAVRGIDRDPAVVAELIGEVLTGALEEPGLVFVTKHFPGLGQTSGDTHDSLVVSPVMDFAEAERHLVPFRSVTAQAAVLGAEHRLAVLASHAEFPFYDPDRNTTVSPVLLQSVLRDEVSFEGIALSDAMWMGPYGRMSDAELDRVYLESFLAGMDMLMIPGSRYRRAVGYFQDVLLGEVSRGEKRALETLLGADWPQIHATFVARLEQSLARIDRARADLGYAVDRVDADHVIPAQLTANLRARYYQILEWVDPRWANELP